MRIDSYRQLEVWQKAVALVTEIYQITRSFPREELYGLTSQVRRAAVSIPANIAEGWGRNMTRDYVQFLRVARGSLLELETHLVVARNLKFIEAITLQRSAEQTQEINRMLNGLIRSLEHSARR
ncbi:MAG TPA: four helix bundle protein [Terriglobia bacterium]|nr:four helix bundle protein [Terriglobia bacterium]